MSKLGLNDDGTITIPLREMDPLTLPEPSIAQLAEMTGYVQEADAALPDLPSMPDGENQAALVAATAVLRERTLKTYSDEAPYGVAIVRIVKLLSGETITLDNLPGWAASPQACRQIIGHWQAPLAGED